MRIFLLFLFISFGQLVDVVLASTTDNSTLNTTYMYGRWGHCQPLDTCHGQRQRRVFEFIELIYVRRFRETENCTMTTAVVNGGYSQWSEWDDCSKNCQGTASKYRTCTVPSPCNGGKDCTELGANTQTKDCGPVDGQWGEWGAWGHCVLPPASTSAFETGVRRRARVCDSPPKICGGDKCIGEASQNVSCRAPPPCLTEKIFEERFLRKDSAMVIYTSSQVDIYTLTKNKCSRKTIIYTYWELFHVNETDHEEQIGSRTYTLKFNVDQGMLDLGLYRLYVKIGYPSNFGYWMEESMYIRIVHPPPHAFIRGGAGRTVGQGMVTFDARSVSYSLTNKPGDPTGLQFNWTCLNFVTKSIYNLFSFNIKPEKIFGDEFQDTLKWYHIGLFVEINDIVAWITSSTLYQQIQYFRSLNLTCKTADYIAINKNVLIDFFPVTDSEVQTTTSIPQDFNSTNTFHIGTTDAVPQFLQVQNATNNTGMLSSVYDVMYLVDAFYNPAQYGSYDVNTTVDDILLRNEYDAFLEYFNPNTSTITKDIKTFYDRLSESYLEMESIYHLKGLGGLPESANEAFFDNLTDWLAIANDSIYISLSVYNILNSFTEYQSRLDPGLSLSDLIGIDGALQLSVDQSVPCLLQSFGTLMEGLVTLNTHDWFDMKNKEINYSEWMQTALVDSGQCQGFNGTTDGFANLKVVQHDVDIGAGFLVFVRIEFEQSVSYFTQHTQSVEGNPPELGLECRLNCMKKTALSSMLSLKASCESCSYGDLKGSTFWWNVKDLDIKSRKFADNPYWNGWMLSEKNTSKFVMKSDVLNANAGYLIEVFFQTANGSFGLSIWQVYSNTLPYNGSCTISDALWGEKKIVTSGWMDEGFRTENDPDLDWKEQISYRIVQLSQTENSLLYYGFEEENYITVKPGKAVDNYDVTIRVEIFDIFIDFTVCTIDLGQVIPSYETNDRESVSTFLETSGENIDYYWKSGDIKHVTMNAEVAGTPVSEIIVPSTIYDTDVDQWVNLGVTNVNDTIVVQTFEELWDMYLNPDPGNVESNRKIIEQLSSFVATLENVTAAVDATTTTKIFQIANSLGTILANKDFIDIASVSNAIRGNTELLLKLLQLSDEETYPKYEDFITVCEGILRVLNNALEGLLPSTSVETPTYLDIYSFEEFLAVRENFSQEGNTSQSDLTILERAFIASKIAESNQLDAEIRNKIAKTEVPILIEAIQNMGQILKMLNYRKQLVVNIKQGHINSTEDSRLIHELVQEGYQSEDVSMEFQESNLQSVVEQNIQVTVYDHNPFSWDEDSKYITSKTVTVSVGNINETKAVIPTTINLKNTDQNIAVTSVHVAIPVDQNEPTYQEISYKIYWQKPVDDVIFNIKNAVRHLKHVVRIRRNEKPTDEIKDWEKSVTPSDWISADAIQFIINGGLYQSSTVVYVGIFLSNGEISGTSNFNVSSSIKTVTLEYQISSATVGCRVWDDNRQKWNMTNCKVNSRTNFNETVCDCSNPPGSSFATTFYVPPNTIDFSSVWSKFDLADNAAVFSTVICLVVLYMLLCIWALRQDRKDIHRWALAYLVDNSPYDDYLYIVNVYTGISRRAGTTSKIRFEVIDGKTKTEVRHLEDENYKGLGAGSVQRFVMSTSEKFSDPIALRIWHDNSGSGNDASWYLNKIVLEDLQTNTRFYFICEKWLSVDEDDGSLNCVVPVSQKTEVLKFSYLVSDNSRKNLTDNHLWFSVTMRPERSNFTRAQRLSCCLALLFLTMITNAMFYGQNVGKQLVIGPLKISPASVYVSVISALIATPPILLVTYLFRNAKQKRDTGNDEQGITSSTSGLPHHCRYLAWIVVSFAILACGFFIILYSMEWGKSRSEEWLLTFLMSFTESIVLVDPVKVVLMSVLLAIVMKDKKEDLVKYDREKLLIETRRRALYVVSDAFDAFERPSSYPINYEQVEAMKQQRKIVLGARNKLIELILFMGFLFVLHLISLSNNDSKWFYAKQHMDQQLISYPHIITRETTQRFSKVTTTEGFYSWLSDTVIPYTFPRQNVDGTPLNSNQRLHIQDLVNLRVGPLRLRQVRSVPEKCQKQYLTDITCFDKYSILDEDDVDYCVGWNNGPCDRKEATKNITSQAWQFTSSSTIWGLPLSGSHLIYSGGGYIAELNINYNISKMILEDLYKYSWIDRGTRAVFTEFTLYNAGANAFVYIVILCEFPETGGVLSSSSITSFRPYQHVGSLGLLTFICEFVSLVAVLIFAVRKIIRIYKNGKKECLNLWNILDLLIITLFLVSTVAYIGRWITIDTAIDKFQQNRHKFVNFSHIVAWDETLKSCLAIIIFLTTFRLMKILSYNKRINQLGNVLSSVCHDLFGCFIVFFIVYITFAMVGYAIFGRVLETYKTVFLSAATLTSAIVGKNSINDLFAVEPVLGRIYYFLFVFFLLWILMTMLNATLNVGITSVRNEQCSDPETYGIIDVLKDIWMGTFGTFFVTLKRETFEFKKNRVIDLVKMNGNVKDTCDKYEDNRGIV